MVITGYLLNRLTPLSDIVENRSQQGKMVISKLFIFKVSCLSMQL